MGVEGRDELQRGKREFVSDEMFSIVVAITQMCIFVKAQTVYLIWVHMIVCTLYLNKVDFKKYMCTEQEQLGTKQYIYKVYVKF